MLQEQIFQLKLNCLQLSAGQLEPAQTLYAWVIQEVTEAEAAKAAAKVEALTVVK